MNALATIHVDGRSAAPAPVEDRFGKVLDHFLPGCRDDERRLRCGIMELGQRACRYRGRVGWDASMVLGAIESIALVRQYQGMSLDELRTVRDALVRMTMAARALDTRGPGSSADASG